MVAVPHDGVRRNYEPYRSSQVLRTENTIKTGLGDLANNKDYLLSLVAVAPQAIRHAAPNLLKDKTFMLSAVVLHADILGYLDGEMQDLDLVKAAVAANPEALRHASEAYRSQFDVVRLAVDIDGLKLKYARGKVNDDIEIVQVAVRSNPLALRYASHRLRDDFELVRTAVMMNGMAIEFASEALKRDVEIVGMALRSNKSASIFCNPAPGGATGPVMSTKREKESKVKKSRLERCDSPLGTTSMDAQSAANRKPSSAGSLRIPGLLPFAADRTSDAQPSGRRRPSSAGSVRAPSLTSTVASRRPASAGSLRTPSCPSTKLVQRPASAGVRKICPSTYDEWRVAVAMRFDAQPVSLQEPRTVSIAADAIGSPPDESSIRTRHSRQASGSSSGTGSTGYSSGAVRAPRAPGNGPDDDIPLGHRPSSASAGSSRAFRPPSLRAAHPFAQADRPRGAGQLQTEPGESRNVDTKRTLLAQQSSEEPVRRTLSTNSGGRNWRHQSLGSQNRTPTRGRDRNSVDCAIT